MSRPIKKRTAKTYARDVESLGRLRTAILMDNSLDAVARGKAVVQLDKLVNELVGLSNSVQHLNTA